MPGADTQVENGNYTRIHNDIIDALLRTKLNATETRAVLCLLRLTYGWNKAADAISYAQFAEAMAIQRRNAIRTMKRLERLRIVTKVENGQNHAVTWKFNKYSDEWDPKVWRETSVQPDTSSPVSTSVQPDTSSVQTSVQPDTKSSVQPDTLQRQKTDQDHLNHPSRQNGTASVGTVGDDDGRLLLQQLRDAGFVYLDTDARRLAANIEEDHAPSAIASALQKLVDSHRKQIKSGRRGITAPLAYMTAILRNVLDEAQETATATVLDFDFEEIAA